MEEFINGTITEKEFRHNFFLLMKNCDDLTNKLILELDSEKFQDFNPDLSRFIGFGNLSTFVKLEFENFEQDYENKEFYESIKKFFLDLQKVLEKTKGL